jgi:hypothetical protein
MATERRDVVSDGEPKDQGPVGVVDALPSQESPKRRLFSDELWWRVWNWSIPIGRPPRPPERPQRLVDKDC